jgi:ABC-type glycerol-3-phosphate transport system substrate-binding protein
MSRAPVGKFAALLLCLCLALPAAVQAAPLTPASPNLPTTDITIWTPFNAAEMAVLDSIITSFEAANPTIQVEAQYRDPAEIMDLYTLATAAGEGPNIVVASRSEQVLELFSSGHIADLTPYATPALLDSLLPVALAPMHYQVGLIGLSHNIRGTLLYRNKSLVAAAPTTYAGLVAAAQSSSKPAWLERGFFYSSPHLYSLGGRVLDAYGFPAFNTAEGVHWLALLDSFDDAGPAVYDSPLDLDAFITGESCFLLDGSWNLTTLQTELGADLAVDAWPTPLAGYVQAEMLYLNPHYPDAVRAASWAFMEYMLSPDAQQAKLAVKHIPAVEGLPISDPMLLHIQQILAGSVVFTVLPTVEYYWDPMDSALTSVFDASADPAAALTLAEQTILDDLLEAGFILYNHELHLPLALFNSGLTP